MKLTPATTIVNLVAIGLLLLGASPAAVLVGVVITGRLCTAANF